MPVEDPACDGFQVLNQIQAAYPPPRPQKADWRLRWLVLRRYLAYYLRSAEYRRMLSQISRVAGEQFARAPGLPHQDLGTKALIDRLTARIESAAADGGMPALSPTSGVLWSSEFNAEARAFFGAAPTIIVHQRVFTGSYLLISALAPLFACPVPRSGGRFVLGRQAGLLSRHLARRHLRQLIEAWTIKNDVGKAPQRLLGMGRYATFSMTMIDSLEIFIVAHEYGHLLIDAQREALSARYPNAPQFIWSEDPELAADNFAARIVFSDAAKRGIPFPLAFLPPLIFFYFMELLETQGLVPPPKHHPSSQARSSEVVRVLLEGLVNTPQMKDTVARAAGLWRSIRHLIGQEVGRIVQKVKK